MSASKTAARQREHMRDIVRDVQRLAGMHHPATALDKRDQPLVIGITSPRLGDGKTTVAMALASSLAEDFEGGAMLLDADFVTHSVGEQFGIAQGPGLVEILAGEAEPADVVHDVPDRMLKVVPAGTALDQTARALRSGAGSQRLRALASESSFVVVDLPAAFTTASAPLLARLCDVVIVVARAGRTNQRELGLAMDRLADSNVVGVVINRWKSRIPGFVERLLGLGR